MDFNYYIDVGFLTSKRIKQNNRKHTQNKLYIPPFPILSTCGHSRPLRHNKVKMVDQCMPEIMIFFLRKLRNTLQGKHSSLFSNV